MTLPVLPSYQLLSIDPGSRKGLGMSVTQVSENKLTVVYSTTINVLDVMKHNEMDETHSERMRAITWIVKSMVRAWSVDDVVSESAYFRRFVHPYKTLVEVISAIERAYADCFLSGSLQTVDPKTVKTTLGLIGDVRDKSLVKNALTVSREDLIIPPEIFFDSLDEHAVDSIAIAYAYFKRRQSCR